MVSARYAPSAPGEDLLEVGLVARRPGCRRYDVQTTVSAVGTDGHGRGQPLALFPPAPPGARETRVTVPRAEVRDERVVRPSSSPATRSVASDPKRDVATATRQAGQERVTRALLVHAPDRAGGQVDAVDVDEVAALARAGRPRTTRTRRNGRRRRSSAARRCRQGGPGKERGAASWWNRMVSPASMSRTHRSWL